MIRFFLLCLLFSTGLGHAQTNTRDVGIAVYVDDITAIKANEEIVVMEITKHLRWQTGQTSDKPRYYYGKQVDEILPKINAPYYQILHLRGSIDSKYKALHIKTNGMAHYQESMGVEVETSLNMRHFPFDRQTIKLLLTPFGASPFMDHLYLIPDNVGISEKAHLPEWDIDAIHSKILSEKGPVYQLAIDYKRMPQFYIYKIFIPLLLILGISYAVLWLPKQPAVNRLAVVITAMLTIVAFQWAVSAQVPTVSYITYLQALLLFFYLLIGSEAVLVVVGEMLEKRQTKTLMKWASWIYPLILLLGFGIISLFWF